MLRTMAGSDDAENCLRTRPTAHELGGLASEPRAGVLSTFRRCHPIGAVPPRSISSLSPPTIGPLPEQPTMHLDRGYDSTKTRDLLEIVGYQGEIATKGAPAPIQVGTRWPVERTHSWMNGYGKRCAVAPTSARSPWTSTSISPPR